MSTLKNALFVILPIFCLVPKVVASDDYLDDDFEEISDTVFTPLRLEQHKKNVPSGVTVISASRIKELGITKLPEAMRLVPGMRITQASGWDYRINFHGTNALRPRRQLVLINGIAIHRYGFAQVDWSMVPFDVEDVERIEVTRNPSSASYGTQAFQTVINIITKHPKDVETLSINVGKGSNGSYKNHGRVSGKVGATSYLISIGTQGDEGFDLVEFDSGKESVAGAVDDHDVKRALFRSNTSLSDSSEIEINAGYISANVEEEEVDSNQVAPPDKSQRDWNFHASYLKDFNKNHNIKIQASYRNDNYFEVWDACHPAQAYVSSLRDLANVNTNAALAILGGQIPVGASDNEQNLINNVLLSFQQLGAELTAPICGTGNQDHETNKRIIEIEDRLSFGDFRVTTGLGYQDNDLTSETYANGTIGSKHSYVFSNVEYSANKLTVNGGVMYESVSTVKDSAVSPRLGFNFHIVPSQTLRLAYSTGKRMPNIFETNGSWSYFVRNWDRELEGRTEGSFYLTATANENLKPESVESYEIGLHGSIFSRRLQYDMRFFREELTDLISEKGEFFDNNLTNDSKAELNGFELESKYKLSPSYELSLGYSYIDAESTNAFESTLHSKHQGFASLIHRGRILNTSLTHYSNDEISGESFDRTDLVLSKSFSISDSNLDVSLKASHRGGDFIGYQSDTDERVFSSYDQPYSFDVNLRWYY